MARGWSLVRVLIALIALGFTLGRVPAGEVAEAVGRLHPGHVWMAGMCILSTSGIGALRWRWCLEGFGATRLPPTPRLVRLYLTGWFYNTFVPGGVGGDLLRARVTQVAFANGAAAWLTVLVERVLGLAALVTVAGLGLWLEGTDPSAARSPLVAALGILVIGASSLGFVRWVGPRYGIRGLRFLPLSGVWGLSVAGHLLAGVAGHALVTSVAPGTSLFHSLVVIPVAQAAVFFPATIGGIGVREAAVVELYQRYGVAVPDATAAAFGFLAVYLASAAVGGVWDLLSPVAWEAGIGSGPEC